MDQHLELDAMRKEVRKEILALKEEILPAQIINRIGKPFKLDSLGYWLSSIVLLSFIILSPWMLIGTSLNEIKKTFPVFGASIFTIEDIIVGFVLVHVITQRILDDIAYRILDKISNLDDLSKLLLWLKQTWSTQNVFSLGLPFCLIWISLGIGGASISAQQFVGFGFSLTVALCGLLASIGWYVPLWIILLISNLKTYKYDVNAFSPAESEIFIDIFEMVTKSIYILTVYGTISTLIGMSSLVEQQLRIIFGIPMLLIGWLLIISQFIFTHSTVSAIINRAKWATLNRIQTKINNLEATGDLSEKDTAERLFRLEDIHRHIMSSKINMLDLKSLATLFGQLMLPLIGLLLGNLDKILALFR